MITRFALTYPGPAAKHRRPMADERLQKIIAKAGVASRRASEKLITEGRVRVNGELVTTLGAKADPGRDRIEVDGYGIVRAQPHVYIALHKPIHVVSTVKDPEQRLTVIDMIQQSRAVGKRRLEGELPRLFPIGRLDFDAEGLILLTNDGEVSNTLMHPSHHVPKTYLVKVKGRPEPRALQRLEKGVRLKDDDGRYSKRTTKPAAVRVFKESRNNTWLEMTITEGRNHQIKRMCEAVSLLIMRLIRIEFGGISIDPLPAGAWRFLTTDEVETLRRWQ